jgi:glutamine synthetase
MTGYTAEKQDSFITPAPEGKALMDFSGKELIKGEPDASSFPSGGLRNTFEARGYTTWDTTSPAFLKDDGAGPILYIPTAFCSYTGEVLDKKTPLLRSMEAISNQAVRVLRLLGDKTVKKVDCSIGPEQEYFIISKDNYAKREDLVFTGRTLFGAMPPKGEEMDDHYLGTIPERIQKFMKEVNEELWKLGVYAKTQHNEVAPGQHEIAVIFETANIATDHNQLVMDILKRVAEHHDLECLLAEKPFAGLSGSGKHDNWSLVTDYGKNLLNPGKRPHENLQFLLFLFEFHLWFLL